MKKMIEIDSEEIDALMNGMYHVQRFNAHHGTVALRHCIEDAIAYLERLKDEAETVEREGFPITKETIDRYRKMVAKTSFGYSFGEILISEKDKAEIDEILKEANTQVDDGL